jgi:acyl-CoA synthetase (AMP-forming)/AMP-acid ligase II
MNFARFCALHAKKFREREFLIESWPSTGKRRSLTWGEFNKQTDKLANYMVKECGIMKGDIVLQFMVNSLEWYVIYMAILKTGAIVSPLNFRFAANDVKYAADVAKCKVLIVDETLSSKTEPVASMLDYVNQFICVGAKAPSNMKLYSEIVQKGDTSEVLADTRDDDMAELMFTSGTTGAPKPVCHTHNTLFHVALGNALTFGEGYESVYLAPHPLYHSGSLFYSFASYISAGKVLMPMELQPKSMIVSMASEKATGGWISVPIWSDIINAIKSGEIGVGDYDFSALRYIAMGAQPVPTVIIEDGKKLFPGLKMMNTYGITEGGGGCTVALHDEDILRKVGSIGRPTPFMDVKIVDTEGKELPSGTVGELLLKGPRLMKEYAFNPEMTARTITDGWLHTGDLAYKDQEGFLYFADRAKDLIIRGGENIFPAEIEDVLRKHPKIQDTAVIGYPHPRLVEITMAIIQPRAGVTIEDQEVLDFCKEKGLAKYKWPEKFVYAEIPRNPAGKIEKANLREKYVKASKEVLDKEFKQG